MNCLCILHYQFHWANAIHPKPKKICFCLKTRNTHYSQQNTILWLSCIVTRGVPLKREECLKFVTSNHPGWLYVSATHVFVFHRDLWYLTQERQRPGGQKAMRNGETGFTDRSFHSITNCTDLQAHSHSLLYIAKLSVCWLFLGKFKLPVNAMNLSFQFAVQCALLEQLLRYGRGHPLRLWRLW